MFFIAGKVHGSLARAGKVRGQTPKVAKQDKKKKPRGRAHKRMQYNRRFVTAGNFPTPFLSIYGYVYVCPFVSIPEYICALQPLWIVSKGVIRK